MKRLWWYEVETILRIKVERAMTGGDVINYTFVYNFFVCGPIVQSKYQKKNVSLSERFLKF